ncbi:3-deoxy-D-manno-octulosonic acid transferase [Aquabacterium sp. J223]|uniref:3-deoxy-D-manno-octulosonic acid transferase n=1 Tax=Aquabacterium sp. J223 TaxID=2898431 RepID=UPI0021AD982A|nr:3-deoxy-D-manno-octulosonic acid transferase [Aquabacterium sp. J223]UUX94840.1 3-deoxy-D-manno-octulosonic acid transferase [Aquabacterium sp. J223]
MAGRVALSPRQALARAVYALALRLLLPLLLARLWWRGRREPGYRHAVAERLGWYSGPTPRPGALWLHAVSLGETRAAAPLVDALRAQRPGLHLLLTHGTATGREAGAALLKPGDLQCWLPFDTPGATRRFMARFRPVLGVLMETELWPHLQRAAVAAQVPVVLANARLSERSLARGRRLAALLQPAAASLTRVLAQTQDDAERLRAFGSGPVEVCGNLKFDLTPSPVLVERGQAWRRWLGRPVVLAASLREGEDAPLLAAWAALPEPRPLLLVVPRHPQRFDEVAERIVAAGLRLMRRSRWTDMPAAGSREADAWLGDSLGEMPLYYALADVALLGGSFAPLGGQNLIEAAACGCPVLMGPHTFNFAEAAELALQAGAAERVPDMAQAVQRAVALVQAPGRARRVEQALAFARAHRGATERTAQRLLPFLDRG